MSKTLTGQVVIAGSAEELSQQAVRYIAETSRRASQMKGLFTLAVSGGSTPRDMFHQLGQGDDQGFRHAETELFWVDERCVSPDHADSNFRMTHEKWLSHKPEVKVHRMRGELDPAQAAEAYEDVIREVLAPEPETTPSFDLLVLGLGDDGHTASLFPGTAAVNEKERWVVSNYLPATGRHRLTLTYPLINCAREIIFLVSGRHKQSAISRLLAAEESVETLPASGIHPVSGKLIWMLDRDVGYEDLIIS